MNLEIGRVELLDSLHSITPEQLEQFSGSVLTEQLGDDPIIMDLFTGNGIAARTVGSYLVGAHHCPKGIILVDQHSVILENTVSEMDSSIPVLPVVADLGRDPLPIASDSTDLVTAKMGFHELPLARQAEVVNEVHRTLKPSGQLIIWENDVETQEGHDIYGFNQIIRAKDKLAGLNQMASQRHFTSSQQLHEMLALAGFEDIAQTSRWIRKWRSYPRLAAEFKGDTEKLHALNQVIDENIPPSHRDQINYRVTDNGMGREFDIPTVILRASK